MEYGCIGRKLSHSFSVEIHNKIGDYPYTLVELTPEELSSFFEKRDFKGINITIPYKTEALKYLDYVSDSAEKIGAVNTVVNKNGLLYGYNTDFDGLRSLIERSGIEIKNKTVAVLGSGGTAKTACCVCEALGAGLILKVSRSPGESFISYNELYSGQGNIQVIINATPCGMFPDTEPAPVKLSGFGRLEAAVDVIYNPLKTAFLSEAEHFGKKTCGGLYMLVSQAVFAAGYFFEKTYSADFREHIYTDICREKRNVVLVGMPSSGKTTAGKVLADKLGRAFFDTDDIVEKYCGCPVKDIFSKYGEAYFRELERRAVKEVSANTGCVIATGGGAVLDSRNIFELKKNGRVYFLDRPLPLLFGDSSRPLSQTTDDMKKLFDARYGLYKSSADCIVDASCGIDETVNSVSEDMYENSCY